MENMENKETEIITLTFFRKWHETAEKYKLTNEQYGSVIRAMCNYCFFGKDTDLPLPGGILFEMSKPHIDKSTENKLNGSEGGKKARGNSGRKPGSGGDPKKKQ